YHLRKGEFKLVLGLEYLDLLKSIEVPEGDKLDKEFVKQIWMIPLFVEMKNKRFSETLSYREYDQYKKLKLEINRQVQRILGMP
ncbi:MAG: hypothetical protein AAF960_24955, partial [Bacteroidota bacterium]